MADSLSRLKSFAVTITSDDIPLLRPRSWTNLLARAPALRIIVFDADPSSSAVSLQQAACGASPLGSDVRLPASWWAPPSSLISQCLRFLVDRRRSQTGFLAMILTPAHFSRPWLPLTKQLVLLTSYNSSARLFRPNLGANSAMQSFAGRALGRRWLARFPMTHPPCKLLPTKSPPPLPAG